MGPILALDKPMLLKMSEYIFFLGLILLLPNRFYSYLLQKFEDLQLGLKVFAQKLPGIKESTMGEKLLLCLSEFEGRLSCGLVGAEINIPKFKFYTALILKLLEANRREGISIRKLIPELRIGIQKDVQFEKKISKVIFGGNFQFLVITLATWGFVFFSQQLVEIKLDFKFGFVMAFLQFIGFLALNLASSYLKKKKFKPFNDAFSELYLFSALVEVRLPIKTILNESKIMNGVLVSSNIFHSLSGRIASSVERWKNSGVSPKVESEELIKEVWYLLEENFQDFIKKLEVLKFIIMALLFLPAYFIYLAAIFKFFMEQ
jgi:hypothetical protein